MAVSSQSGQSRRGNSRGRTQAKRADSSTSGSRSTSKNGTSKSANTKSGSNSKSTTNRSRAGSSRSSSSAARANGSSASAKPKSPQASGSNGSNGHETLTNLGVSVFSAAVGVAGGVLLTRKSGKQHRKMFGIPVPDKLELNGVADQIGAAGRQFGELAGEVRAVRQKAEQIGRLLS